MTRRRPIRFLLVSTFIQLFNLFILFVVLVSGVAVTLTEQTDSVITFAIITLGISLFGALLSFLFRLPFGWILFNAFLPSAAVVSGSGVFPSWIFLGFALILAGLHFQAYWTHVPYYPTPKKVYESIEKEIAENVSLSFLDIGCGMGGLLSFLHKSRPEINLYGIEIGLVPYLVSKLRNIFHSRVSVTFQSMWKIDLGQFNMIYAFLSPAPMERLYEKFMKEASPGAILISNSFESPGTPFKVITVSDNKGGILYFYRK